MWLIFTRRGIDINKHPAIKKHLDPYKDRLTPGVSGGRKPVGQIPVVKGPQNDVIETLVSQILTATEQDPNADVSGLERQIDELVYELYGLTDEEIAIVERRV